MLRSVEAMSFALELHAIVGPAPQLQARIRRAQQEVEQSKEGWARQAFHEVSCACVSKQVPSAEPWTIGAADAAMIRRSFLHDEQQQGHGQQLQRERQGSDRND
jgi:hypothetical protein